MPRKRRTRLVAGAACGVAVTIAVVQGYGPVRACHTIGYVDLSAIELRIGADVDAVAACFGPGCRPVTLAPDDGGWFVPQTAAHLQGTTPGSVGIVTVLASSGDAVVVDDSFAIAQRPAQPWRYWRQCPGPMRFVPVTVEARGGLAGADPRG